jgi:histidinol-phosphate aminotransferase
MDAPSPPANQLPAAMALRHLRPQIRAMHGYTPGEQVRDCIKLNTNECPWGPSTAVLQALAECATQSLRLYPDPLGVGLRQAAAARYEVTPEQVMMGNGSDDCLTVLFRAFLTPGERVACPWPTYGLYETLAMLQGAELVQVDYLQRNRQWLLPGTLARQAAKLVIIANPNNPSATLVDVPTLRQLASELDGVLVVDEAYIDFAAAGSSMLPYLDRHPNLVVLRTFSKSYALAGARLGLLFAHPELVAQLTKVKDSYNVNAMTQALGQAALQDRGYHSELIRRTLLERSALEAFCREVGWSHAPSHANFLLCEVGQAAGELYRALKARKILVRYWDTPQLRTKLRISVGQSAWNEALMQAVRELGIGIRSNA